MSVNIINGRVLGLVNGFKFCPACDKAYTPAGYKNHVRSKGHERKLLIHDNHQSKVIADTVIALGGKLLKFTPGKPCDSVHLSPYLGADEYELEIETICGTLFIHPNRQAFLHTRFSTEATPMAAKILGLNPCSGKWNFHGADDGYNEEEIEDFFQQLSRILPGAEVNTVGVGGVAHAMDVLNKVRDSHGGKRWRAK